MEMHFFDHSDVMILSAITNYVFKGLKAPLLLDYDMKSVLNGSTKESFGTVISLYITCVLFFSLVSVFFTVFFTASKVSAVSMILCITCVLFFWFPVIIFVRRFIIIKASSAIPASTISITLLFNCTSSKTSVTLTSILLGAVISFSFLNFAFLISSKASAINAASFFFIPDHVLVSTVICFIIIPAGDIIPTKTSAFLAETHFVVLFRTFMIKFPISSGVSAE